LFYGFSGPGIPGPISHFKGKIMVQRLKVITQKLKRFLPKSKLRADYDCMVGRLKTLESQVESSAKQLELAKSNFLKNIYHEIRTPLNSIMGFTNLLNRDHLLSDQEKDEYVGLINKSSREFLRKMDDIIQASLLEAGMIKVNLESCNLGTFFEENHSFYSVRKHLADKNNLALLLSVDESIRLLDIQCDKFRITQVLTQLIDNAFKHAEKGVIEYGVNVKDQKLEFFVKDSGMDDLKGNEKVIFNRFTKIETNESESGGLGLGLSICKDLVELMGGKIWVDTEETPGATFYFTIPLLESKEESKETKEETTNKAQFESVLLRQGSLAV
jgi:signal transduction histidine kinase